MRMMDMVVESIVDHLRSRGVDLDKTRVIVDEENDQATFMLYNLSGQLVGYQRYDPNADKKKSNDFWGKYYNYITKEGDKTKKLAVWGTETIDKDVPYLFITEGVFDAVKIHNAGYPAIAVLANNPKPLKPWFKTLRKYIVSINDGDDNKAGDYLSNIAHASFTVPEGYGDLGDMPQDEVDSFMEKVVREVESVPQKNKDLSGARIVNPETGNKILVKTALQYEKDSPAYKAALKFVDKNK
jgi:hypothetical protein